MKVESISANTFQIKHLPESKVKCTFDNGDEVVCWAGIGTVTSLNKITGECRVNLKIPLEEGNVYNSPP